jgi:hypothetical protein
MKNGIMNNKIYLKTHIRYDDLVTLKFYDMLFKNSYSMELQVQNNVISVADVCVI